MGRSKRQRQRVRFELESVAAKSLRGLLTRTLTAEFGCNRVEAQALAIRALEWLPALGAAAVPGQTRMSVPATRSKRHARSQRREVLVTAVEVGEDTAVWEAFGLAALQRRRLLRWLDEIGRQGGWASLAELAAWADLTPTALGARLAPVRRLGVWLPHVGGPEPTEDRLGWEAWLVDRYLADGLVEAQRSPAGIGAPGCWPGCGRPMAAQRPPRRQRARWPPWRPSWPVSSGSRRCRPVPSGSGWPSSPGSLAARRLATGSWCFSRSRPTRAPAPSSPRRARCRCALGSSPPPTPTRAATGRRRPGWRS